MDDERNLILGLISCSAFANAEFLLRQKGKSSSTEIVLQEEADTTFNLKGQTIYIKGILRNADSRPLAKAKVEFWQTHQPNGKCLTNKDGEFLLKTIFSEGNDSFSRQIHFTIELDNRRFFNCHIQENSPFQFHRPNLYSTFEKNSLVVFFPLMIGKNCLEII